MTRPPRKKTESARGRAATLSRRAFVVGAGAAVVASATGRTTAADGADGVDEGDDGPLTVEATAPYYPAISDVVDAFERDVGVGGVEAALADGDPAQRVREGPADVFVSGAPLSAGGGSASDADTVLGHAVSILGWATLATRSDEWRESLRSPALTDKVRRDRPVETWSETDWESIGRLTERPGDAPSDQCSGLVSTSEDRTALVRGPRAYQYAHGQGGVGYYEVAADDVGAPPATRRRGEDVVPLVRLGHVTVDEAAVERSEADAFLRFYERRAPPTSDLRHHSDRASTLAAV